jgi:(S)-ureidoglycine aminohydrolase
MKDMPSKPLPRYWAPYGGLPGQHELVSGRAVFTEAYAFIPRGVMTDIVTSALPFWEKTRAWIIARPMSGFSETFSQYIMEVAPGGGSDRPEPDPGAEGCLFMLQGAITLVIAGATHLLEPGGYAFIPPGTPGPRATPATSRRGSSGSARPTSRSRGSACPTRSSATSAT